MTNAAPNLQAAIASLAVVLEIELLSDDLINYAHTGEITTQLSEQLEAGDSACRQAVEVIFQADVKALSMLRSGKNRNGLGAGSLEKV